MCYRFLSPLKPKSTYGSEYHPELNSDRARLAPRTRLRNSSRVRGSSRITPSRRLVVSVDPSMFTPRNVMQLCSALDHHAHALRLENVLDGFGDLGSEFLLDLQPTGEPVHHPRQLGDTHHLVRRQVADVRATDHRQHVMLTKADHADVPQHHKLVVTADFHEGTL